MSELQEIAAEEGRHRSVPSMAGPAAASCWVDSPVPSQPGRGAQIDAGDDGPDVGREQAQKPCGNLHLGEDPTCSDGAPGGGIEGGVAAIEGGGAVHRGDGLLNKTDAAVE